MLNKAKILHKIRHILSYVQSVENTFFRIIIAIAIIILAVGIFYILSIAIMFLLALCVSVIIISYIIAKIKGKKYNRMFHASSNFQNEHTTVKHVKIVTEKDSE